ncbi:MAG: hypothetical protein KKF89_05255 [Nanoarchaeota archaeon]|nr:hypothetical protein [Nanoarchaeota archaeon]MBU1855102.1 hypothetical protein [Nanoarchaeota archaeon]
MNLNKKGQEGITFPQVIGAIMVILLIFLLGKLLFSAIQSQETVNDCKQPYGECTTEKVCKDIDGEEYPGKECTEENHVCCKTNNKQIEKQPETSDTFTLGDEEQTQDEKTA